MPRKQEVQKVEYHDYILKLTEEEKRRYPDYKYRTIRDYHFKYCGKWICIPKGFLTDGPSLPEPYHHYFLKAFYEQWLIHDFVYATHKIRGDVPQTRLRADKYVLNTLKPCWSMVYVCGGTMYNVCYRSRRCVDNLLDEAWEESGNRGPEYYQG